MSRTRRLTRDATYGAANRSLTGKYDDPSDNQYFDTDETRERRMGSVLIMPRERLIDPESMFPISPMSLPSKSIYRVNKDEEILLTLKVPSII